MLASSQHTYHPSSSPHANPFTPQISSPLKPLSPNVYGRSPSIYMSFPEAQHAVEGEQQKPVRPKWESRSKEVKRAPRVERDELKERRRGMFLRKVREGREERRWEGRGEDVGSSSDIA